MYNINIKNMVCARCISAVQDIFNEQGLDVIDVSLGNVKLASEPGPELKAKISQALDDSGFELLDEKGSKIIERIKNVIIEQIHYNGEKKETENYSAYISKKLKLDYNYLSNLFSSVEGITIEKFIILQKTERVKELLVYNELSLGEIAFNLGYSSVQHLSNQFKNVTGETPSQFRHNSGGRRKPLDSVL